MSGRRNSNRGFIGADYSSTGGMQGIVFAEQSKRGGYGGDAGSSGITVDFLIVGGGGSGGCGGSGYPGGGGGAGGLRASYSQSSCHLGEISWQLRLIPIFKIEWPHQTKQIKQTLAAIAVKWLHYV